MRLYVYDDTIQVIGFVDYVQPRIILKMVLFVFYMIYDLLLTSFH